MIISVSRQIDQVIGQIIALGGIEASVYIKPLIAPYYYIIRIPFIDKKIYSD